jgi:superfamily II DNA or RNA helicase
VTIDVDPHLLDIPVNPRNDIKLLQMGGELVVHSSLFTPQLRQLLTLQPNASSDKHKGGHYRAYRYYGGEAVGMPRTFALTAFPNAVIEPPLGPEPPPLQEESKGLVPFVCKTPLLEPQEPVVDRVVDCLLNSRFHSALLQAPCGTGKTVMSFKILERMCKRLGRPLRAIFCIYVDKQLRQTRRRLQQHCPGMKVGIFRGKDRPDPMDHIVICSMDTLRNLTGPEALKGFDVVMFDEVHHLASETRIATVARAISSLYRYGFTATQSRSDELEQAVSYLTGPFVCRAWRTKWEMDIWNVPFRADHFSPVVGWNGVKYAATVAKLYKETSYLSHAAEIIKYAISLGHRVCVTARTLYPLRKMRELLGPAYLDKVGLVIGAKSSKEEKQQELECMKDNWLGSEQIVLESTDEDFTCVIPLSSIKHLGAVEQLYGRTNRSIGPSNGALIPTAIDYYCTANIFKNHHDETRPAKKPGRLQFALKQPGFSIYQCSLDCKTRTLARPRKGQSVPKSDIKYTPQPAFGPRGSHEKSFEKSSTKRPLGVCDTLDVADGLANGASLMDLIAGKQQNEHVTRTNNVTQRRKQTRMDQYVDSYAFD